MDRAQQGTNSNMRRRLRDCP